MDEFVDEARLRTAGPGDVGTAARGAVRIRPWWAVLVGAGAAVVGLLPWLLRGAGLPLQNLWAAGVPARAPLVLLPFSQYEVTSIFALLVMGGGLAGLTARVVVARGASRSTTAWIGAGLALVQVVAVVQTIEVVRGGLRNTHDSQVYLQGVGAGVLACVVAAWGVYVIIALTPPGGAVFGLTTGAIAAASWLPIGFLGSVGGSLAPIWLLHGFTFATPLLVGAAVAWAGLRTVGRIVCAVVALCLVWVAPAVSTAVSAALGTRILARDLPGMLEYGRGVLSMYLTDGGLALQSLALAVVVAAVGLVGREVLARRAAAETVAGPDMVGVPR